MSQGDEYMELYLKNPRKNHKVLSNFLAKDDERKYKFNVNMKNKSEGDNAIFDSYHFRHYFILDRLLEYENVDVEVRNYKNQTLLMIALRDGNKTYVKKLLSLGANVNAKDSKGRTPLFYSLYRSKSMYRLEAYIKNMRFLLENGADIDVQDNYGRTVAMTTILRSEDREVEKQFGVLLEYNPDISKIGCNMDNALNLSHWLMLVKHKSTPNSLKNIVIRSLNENHKKKIKDLGQEDPFKILMKLNNQKEERDKILKTYPDRKRKATDNMPVNKKCELCEKSFNEKDGDVYTNGKTMLFSFVDISLDITYWYCADCKHEKETSLE